MLVNSQRDTFAEQPHRTNQLPGQARVSNSQQRQLVGSQYQTQKFKAQMLQNFNQQSMP